MNAAGTLAHFGWDDDSGLEQLFQIATQFLLIAPAWRAIASSSEKSFRSRTHSMVGAVTRSAISPPSTRRRSRDHAGRAAPDTETEYQVVCVWAGKP